MHPEKIIALHDVILAVTFSALFFEVFCPRIFESIRGPLTGLSTVAVAIALFSFNEFSDIHDTVYTIVSVLCVVLFTMAFASRYDKVQSWKK